MSLLPLIEQLQTTIDRLRAEAAFTSTAQAYRAGMSHHADQVELIIARRIEHLQNWTPPLCGMSRRHELATIRQAIRDIHTPDHE